MIGGFESNLERAEKSLNETKASKLFHEKCYSVFLLVFSEYEICPGFSARSNWSHFRRLLCVLFMSPWHLLQSFPKIGQLPEGRSLVPKALRG